MNEKENMAGRRLERLLDAAREACPPLPAPSPWFEQRVLQSLRADASAAWLGWEGGLVLRLLGLASVLALVCAALPFLQAHSPYVDAFNMANSAAQTGQIP